MKVPGNFELLSTHPLWIINDNDEAQMIQNKYDTLEVLRVWDSGCTRDKWHHMDYPIEGPIMFVPSVGTIFFSTQEEAARHLSLTKTEQGLQCLIDNAFEASKHNKTIVEFKEHQKVQNGIYSIKEFDTPLHYCWLEEIRYLDENQIVRKVKVAKEDALFYLSKYMNMIDIETRHDLEQERLLFEIYSEDGNVYVNHFFVNEFNFPGHEFYYTRIMNYPLFSCKKYAQEYRYMRNHGLIKPTSGIMHTQYWIQRAQDIQTKKETRMSIVTGILKFAGSYIYEHHLDTIINWVKKLTKKKQKA